MSEVNEVRLATKADVLFLIDTTGSMQPCLDALIGNIENLTGSLEGDTDVTVDWRAKVIGYRDLEEDNESDHFVGKDNGFVTSTTDLKSQLAQLDAFGGGPGLEGIPESALDALLLGISMPDWLDIGEGHRIIVLLTDAPTKPTSIDGKDAQDIAQMAAEGHFRVLLYGPAAPEYQLIGKISKSSFTDVASGASSDVYEGLKNLDWAVVFETLRKTVSMPVAPVPGTSPTPPAGTKQPPSTPEETNEDSEDILPPPSEDDLPGGGGSTVPAG